MLSLFAKKIPPKEQIQLVKEKVEEIANATQLIKIILIGSASRLQMTEASDIDLILIIPDHCDHREIYSKISKMRSQDSWPQDLLIASQTDFRRRAEIGGIYWIADNEGVEVYPHFKLGDSA